MTEPGKPRLAHLIRVERSPHGGARIYVDGTPLPWMVEDGISTSLRHEHVPGLTVTLLAERVEVVDAYLDDGEAKVLADQHSDHLQEPVDTQAPAPDSSLPAPQAPPEEVMLDLDARPDDPDELARHEKLRERVIHEVMTGQRPKARLKADR